MRYVFVDVRADVQVNLPDSLIDELPDCVGLFTTAQYLHQLDAMKHGLESRGKSVKLFRTRHSAKKGQLLGCNIEKFSGVDCLLFVGDGTFHSRALAMNNEVPVFVFNPLSRGYSVVEAKSSASRIVGENVGVLVTTKTGQQRFEDAIGLRKRFPDKRLYFLLADELRDLENFPFLDGYVNTACPRIGTDDLDKPCVNIDDI